MAGVKVNVILALDTQKAEGRDCVAELFGVSKMQSVMESPPNKLMTIREVAERLGVTPRTVWNLIAGGEFPRPLRVGGSRRFQQSDIQRYIAGLDARRGEAVTHD